MINIFDGFAKLSDDEIRGQIALLKCMTLSNTIKERSQKAMKFLVDAAGGMFGRTQGTSEDDEIIPLLNIRKMVNDCFNDLREIQRNQLDMILKQELINKCCALGGYSFNEETTEDTIYIAIVREASKLYMIDDYKTPGQKTDEIHDKYYEHYLKVLQKKIIKVPPDKRGKIEMQLQKTMAKSDIGQLRQLAGELMMREFNGKTILDKIITAPNTNVLKKVIDVMGLGIFDGIDGVISTAYDSMLMFSRIERAILAQSVWTAANGYGKKLRLNDDLMPSYSSGLPQEEDEKERKLLILISREAQLNKVLQSILSDIDKNNRQLVIMEDVHERDKEKLNVLQAEYRELLESKDRLMADGNAIKTAFEDYIKINPTKNNSDIEFRKLKQEYENLARNIRNLDLRIVSLEKTILRLSENLENQRLRIEGQNQSVAALREELICNVNEFNEVITLLEDEAGYRSHVLKKKWKNFYFCLEFEDRVYENVVKQFTQREIVALERMLKEMDTCDTRSAFANGNMPVESKTMQTPDGADKMMTYTYCLVSGGKYAKIIYDDIQVFDIQVKDKGL